ncbi:MAG TPA: BlaI/MecI/CopY family transcriptional regulator, partial [Rhizomicrobium sp.]
SASRLTAEGKRARRSGEGRRAGFSRRGREIMEALHRLGKASAAEIHERIPELPTYTAIRTHLTILEKKGHVRHESDGTRYMHAPLVAREQMGRRADAPRRQRPARVSRRLCAPYRQGPEGGTMTPLFALRALSRADSRSIRRRLHHSGSKPGHGE